MCAGDQDLQLSTQIVSKPRDWVRSPFRVSINGKKCIKDEPWPLLRGMENVEETIRENGRQKPMRLEGRVRAQCPGNQRSHLETMAVG